MFDQTIEVAIIRPFQIPMGSPTFVGPLVLWEQDEPAVLTDDAILLSNPQPVLPRHALSVPSILLLSTCPREQPR